MSAAAAPAGRPRRAEPALARADQVELVGGYGIALRINGAGTPLLWGHAMLSNTEAEDSVRMIDWGPVRRIAQVIRFDAVGHGRSAGSYDPADHEWPSLADDLLQLATRLGHDRFVAGGTSMGAAAALYAALDEPERIRGLVLVAPPAGWSHRVPVAAGYRVAAYAALAGAFEPARCVSRFVPFVPPVGRFEIDRILARWRHVTATSRRQLFAALLGASRSDLPSPEELRTIAVPTLVIGWRGDPVHPHAVAEKIASLLPDARLHLVTMPDPDRISSLICDFLVEIGAAAADGASPTPRQQERS
jgi:3-oxoadipate enol-lactonase